MMVCSLRVAWSWESIEAVGMAVILATNSL